MNILINLLKETSTFITASFAGTIIFLICLYAIPFAAFLYAPDMHRDSFDAVRGLSGAIGLAGALTVFKRIAGATTFIYTLSVLFGLFLVSLAILFRTGDADTAQLDSTDFEITTKQATSNPRNYTYGTTESECMSLYASNAPELEVLECFSNLSSYELLSLSEESSDVWDRIAEKYDTRTEEEKARDLQENIEFFEQFNFEETE